MALSDKITLFALYNGKMAELFREEDVKEFIREILESPLKEVFQIKALIKNRAGDKLT